MCILYDRVFAAWWLVRANWTLCFIHLPTQMTVTLTLFKKTKFPMHTNFWDYWGPCWLQCFLPFYWYILKYFFICKKNCNMITVSSISMFILHIYNFLIISNFFNINYNTSKLYISAIGHPALYDIGISIGCQKNNNNNNNNIGRPPHVLCDSFLRRTDQIFICHKNLPLKHYFHWKRAV